ncbi:hypothetical protein, partial [Gracilinema caldarium]|uniref:hypothetical protein n=1 Tax=Gracilinema caldarium TaxID=215591 RepID=UPI0026F31CB3
MKNTKNNKHVFYPGIIILFSLIVLIQMPAAAQSTDSPYYIHTITFNIQGITQPFALRNAAGLKEGEAFSSKNDLDNYIKDRTQLLLNNRVLEDAQLEYTLGEPDTDGRIPVYLAVRTTDTWNIIALPYFKYDSSKG